MDELSPKTFEESKVIAKACNWYDRRKTLQAAPQYRKAREAGRYEQSGEELAEAVEKMRKAGKAGAQP